MKKSFYQGYYGGFYNKSGTQMAKGDIVLKANGDIVEKATGDVVFNAKGDIVRAAKGDIVNAKGDITRAANGDIVNAKGDLVRNAWGEWEYKSFDDYELHDYGTIAPGTLSGSTAEDDAEWGSKVDTVFGWLERGTDVFVKLKDDGTQIEDDYATYNTQLGEQPKKDLTMWYVAGGAIVLLVVVGVVIKNQ